MPNQQQELTNTNQIPKPEHPRPDWQRKDWYNLNGAWKFHFVPRNGEKRPFTPHELNDNAFESEIIVPFSWSSPLSGADIEERGEGWYRRTVRWKPSEPGSKVFLRFGAVDYLCDVWINGTHAGIHQGGYGTFEFEVTSVWKTDGDNIITVRAVDEDEDYQTRGKQGYGEIRGIWQTVWLEARPVNYIKDIKFITSLDGTIRARASIMAHQSGKADLNLEFPEGSLTYTTKVTLAEGENIEELTFKVENPKLWSPETPYLYEGTVSLAGDFGVDDVATYFGIREISTAKYEERKHRWIMLNGKPTYINGTLDQSFHRTGYFTYPSDEEMRDEIFLMKRLGLNLTRIHIKPEEPRKLYWADKLGMLVMQDMPCFWGEPDEKARTAYESEAQEVIERDYNHPSIISWVMFNETWGLKKIHKDTSLTSDEKQQSPYQPETQEWVRGIYHWAKQLDTTRLIEDNSPCNYDHVESDLNTWHFYINGYEEVRDHLNHIMENTYPGSSFNYIGGNVQSDAPLMNSECGNVWGLVGGGGDSDLAWHYRYMLNEFRKHDKMCGFIFTEFRDVTNEFNGYYRLDGTDKQFGYEWFVPGMSIADLHTPDFIIIDAPPCQTVEAGEQLTVALLRSSYSDEYHGQNVSLRWELWYDRLGIRTIAETGSKSIAWDGYGVGPMDPLAVRMPEEDAVAVFALSLLSESGEVIARNFTAFDVRNEGGGSLQDSLGQCIHVAPAAYEEVSFDYHWTSIQGAKLSGGGEGRITYSIELPEAESFSLINEVEIVFEASSKRLWARHVDKAKQLQTGISMMHGRSAEEEYNPNTYYMTDEEKHESRVTLSVDGEEVASFVLEDDPADSRGVLSWHYQPHTNKLDDAGSYGYLCKATLPGRIVSKIDRTRRIDLTLHADSGGLALYGRNAGRYPIDLLVRCR